MDATDVQLGMVKAFVVGVVGVIGLLALTGCAAASADGAPAWRLTDSSTPHFRFYVANPELVADVSAAVDLWERASDGAYTAELTNDPKDALRIDLVDAIPCDGSREAIGCTLGTQIWIASTVMQPYRVSTIAHEIGHTLSLAHTANGLMNPHRSNAERLNPCVSASDVAAASLADVDSVGACLSPDAG